MNKQQKIELLKTTSLVGADYNRSAKEIDKLYNCAINCGLLKDPATTRRDSEVDSAIENGIADLQYKNPDMTDEEMNEGLRRYVAGLQK